jgi:hypothetical protein
MPSGNSNTQIQKTEPSDWSKGWMQPGMEEAQSLFKEGAADFYPGSTVAGFSPETSGALNAMTYRGMNGAAARVPMQHALNVMSDGQLMDTTALDGLRNIGNTNGYALNPATAGFASMATTGPGTADRLLGRTGDIIQTGGNNLATFRSDVGDIISGAAQNANPAYSSLGLTADGGYLAGSPFADAAYNKAADAVTRSFRTAVSPAIDGRFAMTSGGSTSGARLNDTSIAEDSLGRTLSGLATDIYGGNYQAERDRQLSAANSLGSLYQSGLGLRTSAAGTSAGTGAADTSARLAASTAVSGAESDDAAKKLAANQALGSLYESGADRQIDALTRANSVYNQGRAQQLQALGLQPAFQDMDYRDLEAALGAGQARDTQAQNLINADIQRYDYGANAPWNNVARYMAMVNGGTPGTSTSMTTSGGNPLASLFAGAGGLGQLAMAMRGLF